MVFYLLHPADVKNLTIRPTTGYNNVLKYKITGYSLSLKTYQKINISFTRFSDNCNQIDSILLSIVYLLLINLTIEIIKILNGRS